MIYVNLFNMKKNENNLEKTVKIALICYASIGILFVLISIFLLYQNNVNLQNILYPIIGIILIISSFIVKKRINNGFYKNVEEDKNFAILNFGFITMTTSITFSQNILAIIGIIVYIAGFFAKFPKPKIKNEIKKYN